VRLSLTTFGPQAKNIASSSYIRARTAKLKEVISGLFFFVNCNIEFQEIVILV
jgi:hypothetical protein